MQRRKANCLDFTSQIENSCLSSQALGGERALCYTRAMPSVDVAANRMWTPLRIFIHRHRGFLTLFLLFFVFRLLAIMLFRTGGFIADVSDHDYYFAWGQLGAMGYRTFHDLWSPYPPLFSALMLPAFELTSRIPPWVEPRLFFHLLFGFEILLFECGNFVLIYRLALKLEMGESRWENIEHRTQNAEQGTERRGIFGAPDAVLFYALLFTPVFSILGWFEAMPLFFLLLGLDLLLDNQRWGWVGSAVAAALGFLTKFTPMMLAPVVVRWLGAKLSWRAARDEWLNANSPGNLLRPLVYLALFGLTVIGVGYWLVGGDLRLALSSLRVNDIRPPWQSLWAVLDSYGGFGLIPLDLRNLEGLDRPAWESRLPWPWITAGFALLYLWLYTRPYDWRQQRTPVAFTAVSVIWLLLYNKGWSPQFLVWVLAFLVLLLPTVRGVVLASVLAIINVLESHIYLILLPDERWLLVGTVIVRTLLLVLIAVEFLGQIWPAPATGERMIRLGARLSWAVVAATVVAGILLTPRAAAAYQNRRLAEHPCREAIAFLQAQADEARQLLVSDQLDIAAEFYPWVRGQYMLRIIDSYNPQDRPAHQVVAERLDAFVGEQEFWWIERPEPLSQAGDYFARPDVRVLEQHRFGPCLLKRVRRIGDNSVAVATPPGGELQLLRADFSPPQVGAELDLVLYWLAAAPVEDSYSVFTQVLNATGQVVAQQDNPPVNGQAPTDTWAAGAVVRDPYRLHLPAELMPGDYRLIVGMYNEDGRVQWRLPSGEIADYVGFDLSIHE
jgi:hypothetical protein